MAEAIHVRKTLDRFEEQNWNRHTGNAYETTEEFMQRVVEEGTFTPDVSVDATLNLTMRERITGTRQQDMSAMIMMGMLLGAALERDVPMDSKEEELWRQGEFSLPDGDS